jgi:hypothetical protein
MADLKISALTAASTPLAGTEVLPIVQSGATVKASIANVQTSTYSGGTANGVAYLNGSKVLTTGSALQFDGSNLLLGTTSAIDGGNITTNYNGDNVKGLVLNDNTPANTHCYIAFDKNSGTQIGTITNNANTGVLYNVTSDYRLKNVIANVSGSGERLDALEPIEYEWKETGLRTRGFLAHKFQEVYANSVTGTKDAADADGNPVYQAMQAGSAEVIADLVAEIKSLRQRLAAANL